MAIARPQNTYSGHVRYTDNSPIFVTTLEADLHTAPKGIQQGDLAMMHKRLKVFKFQQSLRNIVLD